MPVPGARITTTTIPAAAAAIAALFGATIALVIVAIAAVALLTAIVCLRAHVQVAIDGVYYIRGIIAYEHTAPLATHAAHEIAVRGIIICRGATAAVAAVTASAVAISTAFIRI